MTSILKPEDMDAAIKKGNVKYIVDDKTVIVGRDTKQVSKKETQQMLEEQLDVLPKGETRTVYDKVWGNVKKYS